MARDTRAIDGLGVEELAAEMTVELPERPLMRHHRRLVRHHGNGFGGVSNVNVTSQHISNGQFALGFGGGSITQIGGNTNYNSNVQFGS